MKSTAMNVATVAAYLGVLGLGYRLFNRLFAELGGSQAIQQIATGRVSHGAADERTDQNE